jgi:hypothetical protein
MQKVLINVVDLKRFSADFDPDLDSDLDSDPSWFELAF